jgi:hypothetical protein
MTKTNCALAILDNESAKKFFDLELQNIDDTDSLRYSMKWYPGWHCPELVTQLAVELQSQPDLAAQCRPGPFRRC